MLGGGRALLLQAAHPLALAGVMEHSDYERDVWGRLRSTMTYVWGVVYGSPEEAERLGRRVRAIHRTVRGTLPRQMGPFPAGTPYSPLVENETAPLPWKRLRWVVLRGVLPKWSAPAQVQVLAAPIPSDFVGITLADGAKTRQRLEPGVGGD